jgi:hypothetical protein
VTAGAEPWLSLGDGLGRIARVAMIRTSWALLVASCGGL